MGTVILMRGIPGSGKSHLAAQLAQQHGPSSTICSADHHFAFGESYDFDTNELGYAHKKCFLKFLDALENEVETIIVDNSNCVWRDVRIYIEYAALAAYQIRLCEPRTPWKRNPGRCTKKNVHGVPFGTIDKLAKKYHTNVQIIEFAKPFGARISTW
jgi:predicted kinase